MPPMRANPEDLKLPTPLSSCSPAVLECLEAIRAGDELTFDQGLLLANAQGDDLQALVTSADTLRSETVGDAITYVVNRNINFTNICFVGCSFCGFGKGPGAPDAYSLSADDVVRKAQEAWDTGATEVCIQGGLPRDLDGISYRVDKTGMPLREYLRMMKDEGLGSIPGTAAEILDDRVRRELSPNKLPV